MELEYQKIDVKKLLIMFYIIIPMIFFSIPLWFIYEIGEFSVHFYGTYRADLKDVLDILIGHFCLGMTLLWLLSATNYKLYIRHRSFVYDSLAIFVFLGIMVTHGIIAMLLSALFFVIIGNVRISNLTFFVLLILAFLNLIIFAERVLFAFVMLAWSLNFISKKSIGELFLFGIIGVFGLIYILQPLKYGELPFSNFGDPFEAFGYLLQHVFPIYYTAYLSNSIDFSLTSLIAEFIPFAKSLTGEMGIVERLAIEGLPDEIIYEGGRLGSNSAMYFSGLGLIALFIMFVFIKANIWILKSRILMNSVLIYFVIQGPYFVRRSFASFTIDIIVIVLWVFLVSFIIMVLKDEKRSDKVITNE